ncbi:MAG TPA: hypothetical protein VMH90_00195, partial [Thermoplasmata archaeon]|nr:hypothetical protein [Thermoplasmata archaeon]
YNVTSSAGSPIGSAFGAAVDDTYDSYVLLFGGYNSSYGVLPYAYSFSYGSWNYQPVSAFPPGWQMFGMAYDPAISGAVLFGGLNATSVVSAQTWTVTG